MSKQLAVQLWTVRDEMARDLPGTFSALAEMGYQGVELWFDPWPEPQEVRRLLDQTGLQVAGAHVLFLDLRDRFDEIARWHEAVGNRHLIIPHIPDRLRQTPDDWRQRVEEIHSIAERCREANFTLSYHNHAVEFIDTIDGEEIQDYIYRTVPADLLKAQIDTYFVAQVGKDPAAYIRRYAERMAAVHLKDKSRDPQFINAPVGQGTIDWDAVLPEALGSAAQWLVVEENCQGRDALSSCRESFRYLQERLARKTSPAS